MIKNGRHKNRQIEVHSVPEMHKIEINTIQLENSFILFHLSTIQSLVPNSISWSISVLHVDPNLEDPVKYIKST